MQVKATQEVDVKLPQEAITEVVRSCTDDVLLVTSLRGALLKRFNLPQGAFIEGAMWWVEEEVGQGCHSWFEKKQVRTMTVKESEMFMLLDSLTLLINETH